ncbi:MAG: 6,7-dimethyl-8-ribityllumazine synthase [Nevskia sp.]|nr:6,7-dimethyl-8-ribityllumazine synthase [Nevskia sp.]
MQKRSVPSPKTSSKKIVKPAAVKAGYAAPAKPGAREFQHVRIAVLATRWNLDIVDPLIAGARRCLQDWGVPASRIEELRAPGAFELPLAVAALAKSDRYDGVVVLGAVIRGDTPHFEFVAGECSRGLREVSTKHRLPLGFGVLTVNTPAQAQQRAGGGDDNKGYEAAAATLEMIRLLREIDAGAAR